ncbi:MAG: peptidylprolyl isomerase [Deltaproteobacteria bacterium]|nr:peptidylprolyl isomerase [Deltaproteobacteria bacterium]
MRTLLTGLALVLLLAPAPAMGEDPPRPPAAPGEGDSGELLEGIVAVVGSRVVTRYDLRLAMLGRLAEIPEGLPKEEKEARFQDLQREVLDNLVDNELVLVAGERQGIEVSPQEVDGELLEELGLDALPAPEAMETMARERGFDSSEHLREMLRGNLLRRQVVMMQVRARVKVSDRELDQEFASRHPGGRYRAVHLAHVLLRLDPTATMERFQEAWARGLRILERVRGGELTFEEAARQESDDRSSGEDGGLIGFVTEGTLEKEFEELVFRLPLGEVGGPVRSNLGVHLVKVAGEEWRTFVDDAQREEFRLRLRGLLEEAAYEQAFRRWLEELRASTKVELRL